MQGRTTPHDTHAAQRPCRGGSTARQISFDEIMRHGDQLHATAGEGQRGGDQSLQTGEFRLVVGVCQVLQHESVESGEEEPRNRPRRLCELLACAFGRAYR